MLSWRDGSGAKKPSAKILGWVLGSGGYLNYLRMCLHCFNEEEEEEGGGEKGDVISLKTIKPF